MNSIRIGNAVFGTITALVFLVFAANHNLEIVGVIVFTIALNESARSLFRKTPAIDATSAADMTGLTNRFGFGIVCAFWAPVLAGTILLAANAPRFVDLSYLGAIVVCWIVAYALGRRVLAKNR